MRVRYNFYAHQMDAGGSWLDEAQLYLNPVQALMSVIGREQEACELTVARARRLADCLRAASNQRRTCWPAQNSTSLAARRLLPALRWCTNSTRRAGYPFTCGRRAKQR